jgi:phosphoribosylformylglycinamidine synthase I
VKFGVITFPGSNCDQDMVDVLEREFQSTVVRLWHKDHDLQQCDMVILPGGFSYGDYLRSGAIARLSPIMQEVIRFADKGGYVMGICNGFQILTESGLLPGALLHNDHQKFNCKNVFLSVQTTQSLLTSQCKKDAVLNIPIAHGEGRFYADADTIQMINDNDQVLFRYCNAAGELTADANPNGSVQHIAGITNKNRNVFGMMPHPERAADSHLHNTDGKIIFQSILSSVLA